MIITLAYDSTADSAPAGFKTALQAAASILDSVILNPINLTIRVGYGEYGGIAITGTTLAESQAADGAMLSYAQLVADIRASASSTDDTTFLNGLPAADPSDGGLFYVSIAQEKAWGLVSPASSEVDGYVGFSSLFNWDTDPGNGIAAGTYDLVGMALHELTHVLGRAAPNGFTTSMDLLGYGANGQLDLVNSQPRYLSIDGGKTALASFDTVSDPSDFAAGSPVDPFDAYYSAGQLYTWTGLDSRVMNVLGYDVAGASAVPLSSGLQVYDTSSNTSVAATGVVYTGPVAGLASEYVDVSTHNLAITALTPNWFIHTGAGEDAVSVSSGTNVLDGGTGSNFLSGGTGQDTFFLDDRASSVDIWSTVVGFHAGDAATVWGVTQGAFTLTWLDGQGAPGFTGLTLTATADGKPNASLTIAGFTKADLTNGRLAVSFGTDTASGSAYMLIQDVA